MSEDLIHKTRYINVSGRKEHEAILKDRVKCAELGIDQIYETMIYLARWKGWLDESDKKVDKKDLD